MSMTGPTFKSLPVVRPRALQWALAALLAAAALVIQLAIRPLTGYDSYEVFLGALALCTILCGRTAGFLTLLLSALANIYFLWPPYDSFALSEQVTVRLILFLGIGTVIVLLAGALLASRQTLAAALAGIGDAVIATDQSGRVRFMNQTAQALSGWKEREAHGRSLQEVVPLVDEVTLQPIDSPVDKALREKTAVAFTNRTLLLLKDGRKIPIEDSAAPILDVAGKIQGVIMVFHDVTRRRGLEAELRQAHKLEAIGRLAGGIAHDFNNLLTVITSYSELVLASLDDDNALRQDVVEIRKAADRAAVLTRQLLAFSRKQLLKPVTLDLNHVVVNMDRMLRRLIGEHIELVTSLSTGLEPVRADPGQLEQVIVNLCVNARDAMPGGGRITIQTANVAAASAVLRGQGTGSSDTYVMLAVTDTGIGMTPEVKAHVFEPFFTTKRPETSPIRGTGLGLATVYGIVTQSGGHITVQSEPGAGSTFKIWLPLVKGGMEESVKPYPVANTAGTETVLLVEDEEGVRSAILRILRQQGYKVLEAHNPDEALLTCQTHDGPIHLMITDIVMPGKSGRELARLVAELRPGIKLLYISGYAFEEDAVHKDEEIAIGFLQKPFEPAELALRVRQTLDTAGPAAGTPSLP